MKKEFKRTLPAIICRLPRVQLHIRAILFFFFKMAEVDIDLYADDLDQGFPLKVRYIEQIKIIVRRPIINLFFLMFQG